jgi:CubicO group peptidase (beta-lactamase class C family)
LQDVEAKKPMAKDSIFQIMSMTKPMVAVAILMLAEEGRLSLTDRVETYIPAFERQRLAAGGRPARPITIRDLLTHTSGMPTNPAGELAGLYQTLDRTLADAVAVFAKAGLDFLPGQKWQYSNIGMDTLGRIIEVVSKQSFEQFMERHLFRPLGMKDTFFFPPPGKTSRISAVYEMRGELRKAGSGILGGDASSFRKGAVFPAPSFGAYSTAADLFAFHEMVRRGGTYNGTRFLSPASVRVMTMLHTGEIPAGFEPGIGYTLGWVIVRDPLGMLNLLSMGSYGHGGAFGTHGWVDPEKEYVGIYLVQGGSGTMDGRNAFMRLAGAALN